MACRHGKRLVLGVAHEHTALRIVTVDHARAVWVKYLQCGKLAIPRDHDIEYLFQHPGCFFPTPTGNFQFVALYLQGGIGQGNVWAAQHNAQCWCYLPDSARDLHC